MNDAKLVCVARRVRSRGGTDRNGPRHSSASGRSRRSASTRSTRSGGLRRGSFSLRVIYLHLIDEYARHNGHADLLPERIDGVTHR